MSYILDALKKSEAERSRGNLPALLATPPTSFKSNVVKWTLLGALLINAALLTAWLYRPTQATLDPQQHAAAVPSAPDEVPAVTSPDTVRTPRSEVSAPIESMTPTTLTPEPTDSAFAFSTHVYADDPTLRAVTLNGRRLVEGDTISAGVQLKEITETGVVLEMNGRIVAMDVLQDWR